jgi:hypothetical protein
MNAKKTPKFLGYNLKKELKDRIESYPELKEDQFWPYTLLQWEPKEIKELERRLKALPSGGCWDTVLSQPLDLCLAIVEDPENGEMQNPVMKCTLEYRKEIGK